MDIFSNILTECSWQGLSFPTEFVTENGSQRLAIHHLMDRDSAMVEATGRAPYTFAVRAFFIQGLNPGKSESWNGNDLYPSQWLKMRALLMQRGTGIFVHPLYGNINCKVVNWHATHEADVRNGVVVDLEFIETLDDTNNTVNLPPTVITGTISAASNMDSSLATTPPPSSIPAPTTLGYSSFTDAVNGINTMPSVQAINAINKMSSSLFTFAGSVFSYSDDSLVTLLDATYQLIDSLNALKLQFQTPSLQTAVYTVYAPTTLATVANYTNNSIDNIIALNPALCAFPILPAGTQVTYFIP